MSNKIKNNKKSNKLNETAMQLGLMLMAGAATVGMIDLPDHHSVKIAIPNQPAFAWANNNLLNQDQGNTLRRERDETAPHYISYSEVQRTASRAGNR